MIKLTFLAAALLCALVAFTQAPVQTKTITGTVTDMASGKPLAGVKITAKGTSKTTHSKADGKFSLQVPASHQVLVFSLAKYVSKEVMLGKRTVLEIKMRPRPVEQEVVLSAPAPKPAPTQKFTPPTVKEEAMEMRQYDISGLALEEKALGFGSEDSWGGTVEDQPAFNTENYDAIRENGFLEPAKNPLSTFSIDVDKASYANVRRFLNYGQKPPKDAVRIEELINYCTYNYPEPKGKEPFAVHTELSACPWNKQNQLLHIGIQGKNIPTDKLPPANLVFLIDVSGSMDEPNKLPLVIA
ncbi:MAG TPA: von Willebrand factor type A domain-containing protein, partial [Adhaeribacter sp.]|nr:von Willebrand factor type A domain-containing protein [Adhaeribacter sp.]